MAENYDELLRYLEGYEDVSRPREVPESVLAKAREAIRALQAENEVLTDEVNDWRDSAKEAALERCGDVTAKHCTCVGPLRADLARVTEERDALANTRASDFSAATTERLIQELRAQLAALRPKAEALDALEKWLRADDWRMVESSAVVGEGEMQVTLLDDCANPASEKMVAGEAGSDLAQAIRAAVEKASR